MARPLLARVSKMVSHDDHIPCLGIRMKIADWKPSPSSQSELVDENLIALRGRELVYKSKDYFARGSCDLSSIAPECREKMCEWCYILSDHGQFLSCREMVAVAFSYLDRYMMIVVDSPSCSRAKFKLAAVTSFYLATKLLSTAQISIHSLVALGRGEFNETDIQNMEKSILDTLEWRMSPMTVQGFVRLLMAILSHEAMMATHLCKTIHERAIFFAELSVYDHRFIGMDRYTVAVSCLLSSIEALDNQTGPEEMEVLRTAAAVMRLDQDQRDLERAQARLWYLYSQSAENFATESMLSPLDISEKHRHKADTHRAAARQERSPPCVRGIDSIEASNHFSLHSNTV